MKKVFILSLVFSLFLSSMAFADTVTVDLVTATADELKTARDAIDKRLAEIRLANAPTIDDSFFIKGSGTQILPGIELDAPFSRFVATCDDSIQVTYYSGANNAESTYGKFNSNNSHADYIINPASISSIMVETQGNWQLDFSPIGLIDSPFTDGAGSYITDVFEAPTTPCIITVTLNGKNDAGYGAVTLYSINKNGTVSYSDTVVDYEFVHEVEYFDAIIKPDSSAVAYFWDISCPSGMQWSITAK